jgi:class 3 adenylate cyclase
MQSLQNPAAPIERVAVFDEAQRAWDKDKAANFMAQRKGVSNFDQSEPEFLISAMDRHRDWCTIVCLIGGGQEINAGEAGLTEWFPGPGPKDGRGRAAQSCPRAAAREELAAYCVAGQSDKLANAGGLSPVIRGAAAMQQVADWLEKLGLGQYAQRFAENDIDASVLPHLTDQSLKELGVSLGHRLKILAAVKELGGPAPALPQPAIPIETKPQDTAERRQVTVMFSDLVGSTALSARMDPEDLREVIAAYQECVAEIVQRFGGFVAKYMGDGVLVYFGYPQAHEDDAERAVRAGLEVIQAVGGLKSSVPLQTRVGIATGLVIVGDLIGAGEAQERGIVGETPNLAARLQSIAEPNAVVIAESTPGRNLRHPGSGSRM